MNLIDPKISTAVKLVSNFTEPRCHLIGQFTPRIGNDHTNLVAPRDNAQLKVTYYLKDIKNRFDGCTSQLKVYAMSSCLFSDPFEDTFTYVNCSFTTGFKSTCPWVEPTTCE